MVQLGELIRSECILLGVDAPTKEDLFARMVECLAAQGLVTDSAQVLSSLQERERVMSTGIGGGVAIPHAQSEGSQQLSVSIARPAVPLDFAAIDDQPVDLIFLVVGPPQRGGFIRVLARISRLLYEGQLHGQISAALTPDEVHSFIADQEQKLQ